MIISLLVVGLVGGIATTALTNVEEGVVAAEPEERTYWLSDFELQYPFLDENAVPGDSVRDPSRVGVRYDTAWSHDAYPGVALCRFDVLDAQGAPVGSLTGDVHSMVPLAEGQGWMPIAVSGQPASVEAVCSKGEFGPLGAGYTFTNVAVFGADGSLSLIGDIGWTTGDPPGISDCSASFVLPGGTSRVYRFTFGSGEGEGRVIALLPASFEGASLRDVSCERLTSIQP